MQRTINDHFIDYIQDWSHYEYFLLGSYGNIEQFMIEENEDLYDFNMEYQRRIIDTYATIKKEVGGVKLWQAVAQEKAGEERIWNLRLGI